jgi:uncharacterized protein
MVVRVPDIPTEGLTVADVAAFRPLYPDPAWRLTGVNLQLERDGVEVFVRGDFHAKVSQACGRCLESIAVDVSVPVDVRLVPRPATADNVELAADDLDVDFYTGDEVDVGALIENETTLALPMKALCREGCQGLCPVCGANRNVTRCGCPERAPDPRLAVLKDLAARLPR